MDVYYEALGYAASLTVLVSLLMPSLWRLRIINLIGAVAFTGYGVLIGAAPIVVMNALIAMIDVFYIGQMTASRDPAPEPLLSEPIRF